MILPEIRLNLGSLQISIESNICLFVCLSIYIRKSANQKSSVVRQEYEWKLVTSQVQIRNDFNWLPVVGIEFSLPYFPISASYLPRNLSIIDEIQSIQ